MPRATLDESQLHPVIRLRVAAYYTDTVQEVQRAVAAHALVVVGMGQNPFPRKARKALDAAGIAHHDIDYGNYFGQWRRRSALKMWTGWPTLPMVFVRGTLVGGAQELIALIDSGELKRMLA